MFGIGFGEMLIIAVILLIAVGPKQLPSMMKTVGKGLREARKASSDLRRTVGIDALLADDDLRNPLKNVETPRYTLTPADLEREMPPEGVDIAHARYAAEQAARKAQAPAPTPVDPARAEAGAEDEKS
jgi:sec-independent protein translocase protein TatB